jgi:hypothetical protein
MTMHKQRSLFVTGVLLSALVLFGATGVEAQGTRPTPLDNVAAAVTGYDEALVTWNVLTGTELTNATGIEIVWAATAIGATFENLEALEDAGEVETMSVPKTRAAFILGDLTYNTRYLIGVRGLNSDAEAVDDRTGEMNAQSVTTAMTETIPDPEKVTGLELEEGDGMIMAMWTEPDDDIGIHHYKVNVTADGGFDLTMGTGSADTEFTIMNLENGTEYTVKVAAVGMIPGTDSVDVDDDGVPDRLGEYSDEEEATPMMPTPALTLFGTLVLGAGLVAAGRRRLRRRQELLAS